MGETATLKTDGSRAKCIHDKIRGRTMIYSQLRYTDVCVYMSRHIRHIYELGVVNVFSITHRDRCPCESNKILTERQRDR